MEQEEKTMKEFVQEFQKAVSKYKRRALVEEFKKRMNRVIRRKLIEVERPLTSIKQWYEYVTNLDKH